MESHNHPSYVEPYQGAATGVGGIVRDILAMGARPLAVLDSLRFGAPDAPDSRRVLPGVVAGIGGYGNCLGLPNIGGEVGFDPGYAGNPLVNALCVGALPVGRLQQAARRRDGQPGRARRREDRPGRDRRGERARLGDLRRWRWAGSWRRPAKRPSVQVGDPFTEKVLIECCLELFARDLVAGVQDLGGAGLTCAISETAAAGRAGMRVALERVPLREPSMSPPEVLVSESQERMLLVVAPRRPGRGAGGLPALGSARHRDRRGHRQRAAGRDLARRHRRGRAARVAGRRGPGLRAAHAAPGGSRRARGRRTPASLPRPAGGAELRETLLRMAASPNLCDRSWVTEQYDRYVRGDVVLAWPEDAGVLRLDEATGRGVALSVDGNGRSAGSTRTRGRSSRLPRPAATSRRPVPCRWRSRTA